jgi:hypothetical protein
MPVFIARISKYKEESAAFVDDMWITDSNDEGVRIWDHERALLLSSVKSEGGVVLDDQPLSLFTCQFDHAVYTLQVGNTERVAPIPGGQFTWPLVRPTTRRSHNA